MNSPTSQHTPAFPGQIRGVILDLDGTLYDQRLLRSRMAASLLLHYLPRPWLIKDVWILFQFRRLRELLANAGRSGVARRQYEATAGRCHCTVQRVEEVVQKWMLQCPLQHLPLCRFPFVDTLLSWMDDRQLMVAVFSDYPAKRKLAALGLGHLPCRSATDSGIDRLKPDPRGLVSICRHWDLPPEQCLVIGDRDDRDGEAARRAGMQYIIVPYGLNFSSMDQLIARLAPRPSEP